MGNHIFHSIKHIKYEVIQQNIILFNFQNNFYNNFKKLTGGYTIIIMPIMCLVLKFGVANSNDKKNSAYIFSELLLIYWILRGICSGLTLEYNHDNRSPPALKVLMKAWLTQLLIALTCAQLIWHF